MALRVSELLEPFRPISLEQLDERAALQRRVDTKHLLRTDQLARLFAILRRDHRALQIRGERCFRYESVYFDTPTLTTYRDHVDGRRPRAKIRSRLYVDTEACFFEAKLKDEDDETAKEHVELDPADHGRMTGEARRFLRDALTPLRGRIDVEELSPTLTTRFDRLTLVAGDGSERVTCDLSLELALPEGNQLRLVSGYALLETKSEQGQGRCERLLSEAGISSVSFSKYRVGVGLLAAPVSDPDAERLGRYFGGQYPTGPESPARLA